MARPPDQLTTLPTELLTGVLELLDASTLIACMLICRRLKILIDNTASLKYILALNASGMEDGRNSTLSLIERGRRLDAYHSAWQTLTWSDERVVAFPGHAIVRMSGGFLVAIEPHFVHIWQIPSQLRGVEAQPLRRLAFPSNNVLAISIEPEEDLLVILCASERFVLRSAFSGMPHPKAHIFDIDFDTMHPDVLGNLVCGFCIRQSWADATIYNWYTGREMVLFWALDLCLLDGGYILTFEHDIDGGIVLMVYGSSAWNTGSDVKPNDHVVALLLPKFWDSVASCDFSVDAFPGGTRGTPQSGHFFSTHAVRLLSATVDFHPSTPTEEEETEARAHIPKLEFTFPSTVIMDYISLARESSDGADTNPGYHPIPWDEWAPGNVLVTPVTVGFSSRTSFLETGCDCRAMQLIRPSLIKIYDFHPWRVRRASKAGTRTETITGRIEREWLLSDVRSGDPFIDTFLKCTITDYTPSFKVDNTVSLMLAEDALIVIPKDTEIEGGKAVRKVHIFSI
ncbi:hypothetical protein OF83DRAFT_407198 [Amylostereum chailletii]|nr:hypothetical protein OF83DRAFT_407198 [Amylostereum chailletii]